MARSFVSALVTPLLVSSLVGCGAGTNVNQIWGGDDDATDTLLAQAQADYDAKRYDDAESKVAELLDRNPDHEDAAILLGYVSLSQGGVDPYQLARALLSLDTSSSTSPGGTPGSPRLADSGEASSSDASSTLQKLGALIALSEEDFANLSDKAFDNDGGERTIFGADNELLVPAKVNADLRAKVNVLAKMNKALKAICRFVEPVVKTEDARHSEADCTPTQAPRKNLAKSHFLWAFSHLTESMVYQAVLLYQSAGNAETNFQKGASVVNNSTVNGADGIATFVSSVTELNNAVEAVFDTDSEDSMIRATLLDLNAVNLAFGEIVGLPENIKKRISDVLAKISEVGNTFGGGTANNTKALKGQLTEKFTKELGGKIETAVDGYLEEYGVDTYEKLQELQASGEPGVDEVVNNVTSMCTSFDNLTGSLDPTKKTGTRPAACPPQL